MSNIRDIADKLRLIEAGATDGDTLGSLADQLDEAADRLLKAWADYQQDMAACSVYFSHPFTSPADTTGEEP